MKSCDLLCIIASIFASAVFGSTGCCAAFPGDATSIKSDFSGLANSSNGFPGIRGDGWTTKWNGNRTGSGIGGGSIVSQKLRSNNNMNIIGSQHLSFDRSYDVGLLGVDVPYTVSFEISLVALENFGSGDCIAILEGGGSTRGTPSNKEYWGVYFDGADRLLKWYDGSQDSAVPTAIMVDSGATYAFTIRVNPVENTWIGTVRVTKGEFNVVESSGSINLGVERALDSPSRTFRLYSHAESGEAESLSIIIFDLDNLVIQAEAELAVNEP